MIALVIQRLYTGCSDLAMGVMIIIKFEHVQNSCTKFGCSKLLTQSRREVAEWIHSGWSMVTS